MLQKIIDRIPENNRLERVWLMAKFDFVTRYYGSILGLFWALLKPLFQLMIYYVVFTFIFDSRTENFLLFLFIGIITYQFFTESASGSMNIFRAKKYLLENVQINKLDLFYSAICATLLGFVFNFTAFLMGNFLINDTFSWSFLLFPFVLLNLIILVLATQLIFATISIYLKDIDNIWFLVNTMLFWGSGIFFDLSTVTGPAVLIKYINPLAGILMNARYILVYAQPLDIKLYSINLVSSVVLLSIGLWFFNKYSAKALEKI